MKIVDAQVHIWSSGVPLFNHRKISSYSAEDCLKEMDKAGVDAALIHPPGWDPESIAVAEAAAQKYPSRFAILGHFPLDREENRALIDGWKKRPGMLGLRFALVLPAQQNWPFDGTMDWLWPACEKAGIPIALLAGRFLPTLARVAERHPGLKLIIDHFGWRLSGKSGRAFANAEEVAAFARFPNVALKATGAPGESSEPYPYRDIHEPIRRLYDAFGPMRFFWGTDITRMPCSWRQCVTMFTEELPWLEGEDRELVMGRGLCDWLGWKAAG